MIKLENFEVMGWEHAIRGMRNPMNSWEKSDTVYYSGGAIDLPYDAAGRMRDPVPGSIENDGMALGPNDHNLMMKLAKGGSVHAKYRRMITVYVDITAPLYWWKEFDTYKVGTVANSCSTIHKIHAKEFTLEDFSCERLDDSETFELTFNNKKTGKEESCGAMISATNVLTLTISALNMYRRKFNEAKTKPMKNGADRAPLMKKYWWQMIQLLPSSYNQKRTVMLNYEVLTNIYESRKNHKLDEWVDFCKWIESLPYSEIITGETGGEHESI